MYTKIFLGVIATAAIAGAQTFPRNAVIVRGGNPNGGKCTVEVVVDGAAQVEIRGGSAVLRNLSGQPPQWRRFECTSVMPPNPADFRFAGVDGRGRQQLIGDPRNGGAAIVRIDDPENGAEGYTFDIMWSNYSADRGAPPATVAPRNDRAYNDDRDYRNAPGQEDYYRQRDTWFRGENWRANFFQRVRQDLDHATSGAFPFTGDRARLSRTQAELDELQQKLSRGFFDQQELDEVMGALQNVLQANRLSPRDRDVLTDDLSRMRDFRERHEQYGARGDAEQAYHTERDQNWRGNNWRQSFFQRLREDLDHVAVTAFPFGGDQDRLRRTRYELDELQTKLARGYYDERELDEVMGAWRVVLQSNRLRPNDRDMLAQDLEKMRDFRVRHEEYGAR